MDTMRGFDVNVVKQHLEDALFFLDKEGRVPYSDLIEINQLVNQLANLNMKKINESLV